MPKKKHSKPKAIMGMEKISSSIIQLAHDAIIVIDEDQNIVFFNQGAEKTFGYEAAEIVGQPLRILLPESFSTVHQIYIRSFAKSPDQRRLMGERKEISGRRKDGAIFPAEASIAKVSIGERTFFTAIFRDITEQVRKEEETRLQLTLTRAIAEADHFDSALSIAIQMICEITGWDFGEVWLPARNGLYLEPGKSYYCKGKKLEKFRTLSERFKFETNIGLPGRVLASRKAVWIPDVTTAEDFERAAYAREAGLKAAVGIPILAGKEVVAVMNFFLKEARSEDKNMVTLISTVAAELGMVFARRQTGQKLRESEETQRMVLNGIDEIVYQVRFSADDPVEGVVEFVSERVQETLGHRPGEFITDPQRWFSLIHPEDVLLVQDQTRKIMATRLPAVREYRIKDINGEYRWLEDRVALQKDKKSRVIKMFGVARDVTERKKAEQVIKKSEASSRAVLDSLPAHICVLNAQGMIIAVNKAWENFARENKGNQQIIRPVGANYLAVIENSIQNGDETAQAALDGIRAVMNGTQEAFDMEYPCHSPDEQRWFVMRARPISDGSGGVVVSHQTITERKRAEEALRRAEESYRNIFENSLNGIFQSTPEGRFVMVNPALARIWGYDSPEDLLASVTDTARQVYVDTDRRAKHTRLLKEQGGSVIGFEYQAYRKDGSTVWVSENVHSIVDAGGALLYYEGTVEDISERKRAEAETQLLLALTKAVAEAESFDSALTLALSLVCRNTGWDFGEVWIPSHDSTHLELGSPYYGMESFQSVSKGFEFAPGIGLPGRVWASGKPIWIPDVTLDANFPRTAFAEEAGFKAAVGIPILADDIVVAVINFFLREARQEDERMVALVSAVAAQLGTTFQHKQSEEALHRSEAVLSRAQEVGHIGSWVLDLQRNALTWSAEAYRMFGVPPGTPLTYDIFLACIHPEDRESVDRSWREALAGAPYDIEHRIVVGEEVKWVHERAELQFDAEGAPLNGIGTVQDITERKRRLNELEALLEVSQTVTQTFELDSLLQNILDAVVDVLPSAEKGAILLADEQGNLHIRALNGYSDSRILGSSFPPTAGYSARAFRQCRPLIIPDVRAEEDIRYDNEIEEMRAVQSAIVAPLVVQDKTIGVIATDNTTRKDAFNSDDLRLLTTIASSVALSIQSARLLKETRQRLTRIQALRNIDMAIAGSSDLRVTFNIALDEIVNQLGIDAACILRLDPHTQTLEYAAGRGFRTHAIEKSLMRLGEGHAGRAALERRAAHIADLPATGTEFARANLLAGEDFKTYYAIPLIAKGHTLGVLEVFHRAAFGGNGEWLEFLEILAGQTAIAIDNTSLFHDLERSNINLLQAYDATIEGWSQAMDLRDKETEGHVQRVTEISQRLARAIGMSHEEIIHARRGALLHDIGKIGIPDNILLKADKLTEEEWALMKKHPEFAYNMLSPIAYLKPALDIPYCHHEKWDGTGYPRGLKGEQIPLAARLFAFADVYDALTSHRPYRKGWSKEQTLEYIREQSGKHFDPQLMEIFMTVVGDFEEQ